MHKTDFDDDLTDEELLVVAELLNELILGAHLSKLLEGVGRGVRLSSSHLHKLVYLDDWQVISGGKR